MTNLVPTSVQLPAHLSDRIGTPSALGSALTAGIGGGGGSKFKRISIRGGRFRIRDGSNETVLPDTELRAVIVGASPNTTKSYYKGAYNPKDKDAEKKPDCYSMDGLRPAKDAEDPQSQTCGNCPHNVWGSKLTDNGSKMKACADQKRLAIISADADGADPEVYLFQVTPGALSDFRVYGEQLAAKGFPPEICVTKISFDTKEAYPKAQFKFDGFINEGQAPIVDKLVKSDLVKEIIGEQAQKAEVVEQPVRTKTKAEAEAVAAPQAYVPPPVVIEDAEFEEPVKAAPSSGFGGSTTTLPYREPVQTAPSSALSKDILSILDEMKKEEQDD